MKNFIPVLLSIILCININTTFSMNKKKHPHVDPTPLISKSQREAKSALESAIPITALTDIIYEYTFDKEETKSVLEVDYHKEAHPLVYCLKIFGEDAIYDYGLTLEFMEATKHPISDNNISRTKVADLFILISSKHKVVKIQGFTVLDQRYDTNEWKQQFLLTLIMGPCRSLALKKIKYDKDQNLIKQDIDLEELRKNISKMNIN